MQRETGNQGKNKAKDRKDNDAVNITVTKLPIINKPETELKGKTVTFKVVGTH